MAAPRVACQSHEDLEERPKEDSNDSEGHSTEGVKSNSVRYRLLVDAQTSALV